MSHKRIRIPRENAEDIMRALGQNSNSIEFVDLTKEDIEAKRNYYGQTLKRCEQIGSLITDIELICKDFHQELIQYETYKEFESDLDKDMKAKNVRNGSNYFDHIEAEVMETEKKIKEAVETHGKIRESLTNLIEKKHVLKKVGELVATNQQFKQNFDTMQSDADGIAQGQGLNFLAGTMNAIDTIKMKRMIHRVSRGRAIASLYDLEIDKEEYLFTTTIKNRGYSFAEEKKNEEEIKEDELSNLIKINPIIDEVRTSDRKIFNIIFQGTSENTLLAKILKVCELFQSSRYAIPKSKEIQNEIDKITQDINEKKELLVKTEISIRDILTDKVSSSVDLYSKFSKYSLYKLFFIQERLVYSTLNKCLIRDSFIDGEVWIPVSKIEQIEKILKNLYQDDESKLTATLSDINAEDLLEDENPPTYIETNEFTFAFQMIVSTYGTPRYREVNPAYFTIITFPFMFGIMFGDIAHGLILFVFSSYLCLFNNKIFNSQSPMKGILPARYLLLLMGLFAFFCGLMYNDFLAVALDIGSCYEIEEKGGIRSISGKKDNCTHVFGLDGKWYLAENELAFINSLKMKLSVIFGVAHMVLGIFLSGLNYIFTGNVLDLIFVFIPQLGLMLILFGYMDALIYIKWAKKWNEQSIPTAPDIKSLLMDIFLGITKKIEVPLWGTSAQMKRFHIGVLITAVACILIMLIPKAIIDNSTSNKKYNAYALKYGAMQLQIQNDEKENASYERTSKIQ